MNRAASFALVAVAAAWLAGCDDTVPAQELDNDRIIAVRVTPPHIPAGGESVIDAFVTMMGSGPAVVSPLAAQVASTAEGDPAPSGLADIVVDDGGTWKVVAPDDATLAAARTELGLMPADPIELEIGVAITFAAEAEPLYAIKIIALGDSAANPELGPVMVNGGEAADGMMVPTNTDIPLHVDADVETEEVFWLTSVGDLSDFDDADATLNHDPEADPPSLVQGHLAVVKRDDRGGVCWDYWSISVTE